jgi:wyosine [tRNA(Phe)-imidazoG37] synthetase (radical SAM superfamily)
LNNCEQAVNNSSKEAAKVQNKVHRDTIKAVRDHNRSYQHFTFVYPVISRRSQGLSLGVNLNPNKVCNFNCIYCEVDRMRPGKNVEVNPAVIKAELSDLIQWVREGGLGSDQRFSEAAILTRHIRDIAFSGDGEPTMVNNFAECVEAVAAVKRAEQLTETKIVLITDAAGLDKANVRRGLEIMDANQGEIWAKLDAGTEAHFKRVNRSFIRFERLLDNILRTALIRPIIIQTLLLKVHGESMAEAELEAYCQRIRDFLAKGARIKHIQAYTIARPTPENYATRLEETELEAYAAAINRKTGLPVETFA